ncbi:hypothetical protein, partial [Pseudomonas syringae]|uniref:hypothetical protein n=2 Tax=Pseudomonas syringae TaxID=317 RepID=UPI001C7EE302
LFVQNLVDVCAIDPQLSSSVFVFYKILLFSCIQLALSVFEQNIHSAKYAADFLFSTIIFRQKLHFAHRLRLLATQSPAHEAPVFQ